MLFDPLPVSRSTGAILAVDVGGTKLEVGAVSTSGAVLERHRTPTPRNDDPEDLMDAIFALVDRLRPFDRFEACGVGCGGPMSRDGEEVSPLNIAAWRSFPLAARLRGHTSLPVGVENDAKALAVAEGWVGGAIGCTDYLAMVVSTGVGGGIVLDGRLLDGASGNAGHIGHVVVEPDGYPLPGHVPGVLESEASGTAIAHRLARPAAEASAEEVERVGTLVGRAAGSVANLLDLERCLVAGSVALGYGDVFFAAAQREIDRICRLDHSRGFTISRAGCGSDGPLIGAAAVARFLRCR